MKILFLCSANVGRSQIAEAYYNYFTQSHDAMSAALIEDKGEKYNFSPSVDIIEMMKDDKIDVTSQKIKLLNKSYCENADKIIVFCNIENKKSEFNIDRKDAISFLISNYSEKINFYHIDDPFTLGKEEKINIRENIKKFIKELILNLGKL